MNNVDFDLRNGRILVNGIVIAPLDMNEFINTTKSNSLKFEDVSRNTDWPIYGLKVSIQNQNFWLNVSFSHNKTKSVWLSWNGGVTSQKGYNTTEKELISDKNTLTKFIKKIVEKEPETVEYNHDIFLFDWGYISTSASLQSVAVTLGISWKYLE